MKTALVLLALALALLGYSATMPPYKDQASFDAQYAQLRVGDSQKFYELRAKMLTPKYSLQDYGITALLAAISLFIASRLRQLCTPGSFPLFAVIAVAAPICASGAFVFDLLQGAARGEYPHWADSLGIPLMGVPALLVLGVVWSAAHLAFLAGIPRNKVPLSLAVSRKANPWLLVISTATVVLLLGFVAEGAYWYAVPCTIWLYLYASLAAVRRASNGT